MTVLPYCLLIFSTLVLVIKGQSCFENSTDFVEFCKTTYNGVVNGGRCLFLAKKPGSTAIATSTWSNAFDLCQSQGGGAKFAAIYSNSEIASIKDKFLATIGSGWVWVAFKTSPMNGKVFDRNTHPYNNNSEMDTRIAMNNTFLKLHQNDDGNVDGECVVLCGYLTALGDYACSYSTYVLCSVYNSNQAFKLVHDQCMGEQVVESTSVGSVDECAARCANETWCRSFNWHGETKVCDTFTWNADETSNILSNATECALYSYVP